MTVLGRRETRTGLELEETDDLRGANLRKADLRFANLSGTDLSQALNVTPGPVSSAFHDGHGAKVPADWSADWPDRLTSSEQATGQLSQ
jgi:uncharacterized protein YjbI with pentapeptide repeats